MHAKKELNQLLSISSKSLFGIICIQMQKHGSNMFSTHLIRDKPFS